MFAAAASVKLMTVAIVANKTKIFFMLVFPYFF
jgi:hypothetical protein